MIKEVPNYSVCFYVEEKIHLPNTDVKAGNFYYTHIHYFTIFNTKNSSSKSIIHLLFISCIFMPRQEQIFQDNLIFDS